MPPKFYKVSCSLLSFYFEVMHFLCLTRARGMCKFRNGRRRRSAVVLGLFTLNVEFYFAGELFESRTFLRRPNCAKVKADLDLSGNLLLIFSKLCFLSQLLRNFEDGSEM